MHFILYLLSHYLYPNIALRARKGFLIHFMALLRSNELRRAYFLSLLLAAPYEALAKYGGERGIRTLDALFRTYMISNHAPSTAQTPLLSSQFTLVQQVAVMLFQH